MDVRPAVAADLPAIAAIYDEQVASSVSTFDLEPRLPSVWHARLECAEPGDHFLVAVEGDELWGFAYTTAYRAKPAYAQTREATVYVAASARGHGVGGVLYGELLPAARADGIHLLLAVVALPNAASEALHTASGFAKVGELPEVGWKLDRWVDTALYALVLTPSS